MFRPAYIILIVLILIPNISHAKIETIFADHKHVMGDNDSKNDARRMCFLEAKRKVLKKAGTYIESHTQAKNYQLTKDEINSYASALLKVETVKEEWRFVGENLTIFMTVKAEVDTGHIEKQLAKIKKDTSVQKKIKDQQAQIQEMERKIVNLQKHLGSAGATKASVLRKERNVTFKQIDTIEAKKIEILTRIESRSRDAWKHIEIGMYRKDVKSLIGTPDSYDDYRGWYYGNTKIGFNSAGIVNGVYNMKTGKHKK
jgi:Skp family chaperone for outer membrane proteins